MACAPPRRRSTRRSSTTPTAATRPSATHWCPTTTPAHGRLAGSAAREPASSASTPTTHGTSRAVTTRSAAGSASSSSCPTEVRITLGESATAIAAATRPEPPARCGRQSSRGASSTSPRPSSKDSDPPSPAQLTNALGAVGDEFDDVVRSHPELIDIAAVTFSGPLASTLARLEAGTRRRRRRFRPATRGRRGDLPDGRHRGGERPGLQPWAAAANTSTPSSPPAASCSR